MVCAGGWYVGMVCAEWWYVRNGICGMAGMGLLKWKPEGWECLVYRIVYTPHPCEEFFPLRGIYTIMELCLLFIFFRQDESTLVTTVSNIWLT